MKQSSVKIKATLTLIVCLLISMSVTAQVKQDTIKKESQDIPELFPTHPFSQQRPKPTVDNSEQKMQLARRLISEKRFSDAAMLLEGMISSATRSANVESLLLTCYTRMGNNLAAERLLQGMIAENPRSLNLQILMAEQLMQLDRPDDGRIHYRAAMGIISPEQISQYSYLFRSMTEHGLQDLALEQIDSLRQDRGDDHLFAIDRGEILEKQANYQAAAAEYYTVLDQDSTVQAANAERKLLSLLRFPPAAEQVRKRLAEKVEQSGNDAVLKILTTHYIILGELDRALQLVLHQDSLLAGQAPRDDTTGRQIALLNNRRSSLLLQFILQCSDREQNDLIIRTADYMLANLPATAFTLQAVRYKGDALAEQGRYDEAIACYSSVLDETPDSVGKSELLYRIGRVYLDGLSDYEMAIRCFDSVTSHYPRGMGYLSSMQTRPEALFRMGDMAAAAKGFSNLRARFQTELDIERQEFFLAVIDLANHNYDSCGQRIDLLVAKYPNGFYINDAIDLILINEQADSTSPVREYLFEAVVFEWRRLSDSARSSYQAVIASDDSSMTDFALYRVAKMDMERGSLDLATVSADQIIEQYKESYYFPMALKIKADVLVREGRESEEAALLYRRILSEFPNYPFTTEVRKSLRTLRGDSDQESEDNPPDHS